MTVTEIKSDSHFSELTTSVAPSTLVALYFHTPWADPCKQMNQVFQSLSDVYSSSSFLSIDADEFPEISESFEVSAVPYFVLLRDSTILKELSGADPKELANTIQSLISSSPSNTDQSASTTAASSNNNNNKDGPEKTGNTNGTTNNGGAEEHEETEEELNDRLEKLVKAAPVMLFMKGTPASPNCGFSRQMVGILREHQVRFGFFDILKDNAVREGLKKFSDWPTFPQIYMNGELQGGLDIIKESIEEDPKFFENTLAELS